MEYILRIRALLRRHWMLCAVLLLAFVTRSIGIGYGLPYRANNDEPAYLHAALQMIQLHTLVPALHPQAFSQILPYPPYLAYLLLLPFVCIAGFQFIAAHISAGLFPSYILTHLAPYFLTARFVSVLFATLSVYLVYRIAQALFRSHTAAIAAAFLLATSVLHISLSMINTQWVPTTGSILLALFVLTQERLALQSRYLYAFVIAGIGMGISSFCAFALVLAGLYYFIFDVQNLEKIISDFPLMLRNTALFATLAVVPWLLWHGGNGFVGDVTLLQAKSLIGFIAAPWSALSIMTFSEPVIIALFFGGMVFLLQDRWRAAAFLVGWLLICVEIFYLFFRFDGRFLAPIVPLLALIGGYCVMRLWQTKLKIVVCILLFVPLAATLRLDYLFVQGDTLTHAQHWVEQHLGPSDKVLVYANQFRLPMTAAGVAELRALSPALPQSTDLADEKLDRRDIPYTLNIYNVRFFDPAFFNTLPSYARQHGYEYFIFEPAWSSGTTSIAIAGLVAQASVVQRYDGLANDPPDISVATGELSGSLFDLFTEKLLGDDIVIYRLH